ncbi:MAG: CCA tRNA nucleotidyltransferase [Clostridia bacterium]|nr:CCA tRNA nucleotidyltransferase [Clostridia bacterium]
MQIPIPKNVAIIIDTLEKSGYEAYIVGGCVRDSLLGLVPKDYDICTSAKPEDIISLFEKTVNTGIKHGTVTVISAGMPIEVTTFRLEGEYKDFRRPDSVSFVDNLKADLSRRDFAINAMCYNESTGLIDYFGGVSDLENKVLKTVGEPEKRFREDALRILRLFRFCSVLGFSAEKLTLYGAIENAHLLKNISAERIEKELKITANGKNPEAILPLLETKCLPALKANTEIGKINNLPRSEDLRFFAFLRLTSGNIFDTLKFLKCSNSFREYCEKMECAIDKEIKTRADIKRLLQLLGNDIFDLFSYKSAIDGEETQTLKNTAKEIIKNGEPYKINQLAIKGNDIAEKGYKDKQIGYVLEKLLEAVIENSDINTKEKLKALF